MRFLADENIEPPIVQWLRTEGHDVLSAFETLAGFDDDQILKEAVRSARILVTHDLDFGKLVVRDGATVAGVVLLRLGEAPVVERLRLFKAHWPAIAKRCTSHFVVVSGDSIKSRAL
jgi:predicted nuclease of predicted toxin-antitoxin system